jgi:type IV pilus assembly protein PilB
VIRRPNGIFIVTGPTGSGKTTTLYSGLRIINTVDLKLLTAEDPVEYEIEGIMQVPVNPLVGLTFASALRSFLRQDPDVIMVGEIRDLETAQISIQASLTGHLVLSTLHTNDSAGAVTRLIDMGVEPFLIASTLEAVLAQRLVRRVCTQCKTSYEPPADLLTQLGVKRENIGDRQFYFGKGCPVCTQTGYRGRLGIYEWLRMSEAVRDLVVQRAPTLMIRQKALEQGMRTLRDDGMRAIFDGNTSIEEVIKYT